MQPCVDIKNIQYIECPKGGFHFGETLNMVCLEKSCLFNQACCCACIESEHKIHNTKPLKMVVNEAKHHSATAKAPQFNIDAILEVVKFSKTKTIENFIMERKRINDCLDVIEKNINIFFSSIDEQIAHKNLYPIAEIEKSFQTLLETKSLQTFSMVLRKIVAIIPSSSEEERCELNELELISSINACGQEFSAMSVKVLQEITKKLTDTQLDTSKAVSSLSIWRQTSYKFSPLFKHTEVKLINDFTVKAINNSGYKFAVMEPNLEKGALTKNLTFRIKESSSNWIAVGMCHKKVVETKNYSFNFGTIGHGGYMVSANGGSWSNTRSEFNNSVKAFKFGKGDVITVSVNLQTKKVVFKKKEESYELMFETIVGDELHPCVLFYYINDEVEFLPKPI